jgi:predicted neuraminidase/predicted glycoside hydrolase/deacetylase ChbG (UPF0249 family)
MKPVITLLFMVLTIYLPADNPDNNAKAIVKSEFIYSRDDVPFPSCHASTIAETEEGLVAAWFGGTHEKHNDVGIWLSRLVNGKWTKPVEVANGVQHSRLRYPTWNPVLFNFGNELYLFYKEGPEIPTWWGEYITSADNGKTWSAPVRLPDEILGPVKNKPVLLPSGELLCASSTEHNGWQVHMEFTSDRGLTWERTNPLNDGTEVAAIQPSILIHAEGKLQLVCRSKNRKILTAWSDDNGRSWTKLVPLELPNPNSGIDAVTLKDNRHVLVYNHIEPDSEWGSRNVLNLAVSNDGMNWTAAAVLENDPDSKAEYSYPAVIQSSDGMVHVTYTWNRKLIKHVVLDPEKLELKPGERSRGEIKETGITNAERLGYEKGKKVLLLHMDDLGMCNEANEAGKYYISNNLIHSGAVMMPCPYAEDFVRWAVAFPGADIGVHLTLTSEWKTWRWGTVTDSSQVPGLIDREGKMWKSVREVVMNATPQEVEVEIRAQIDKMRALGLEPTHIDTHMGTLYGSPEFVKVFLKVAQEYGIPANAIDLSNPKVAAYYKEAGYPINDEVINLLKDYSLPKLDNFASVPDGTTYENKKANFFELVNSLDNGLTEIIFHPSVETSTLKSITGKWQQRVWEAKMFADPEVKDFFRENNIELTTWREIMERFNQM